MPLSLFEIPLYQRLIKTCHFPTIERCLHIDEVGVYVRCSSDDPPLTTDYLRHFLTLREKTKAYIWAKDAKEAIQKLYDEWEGARVGGENPEAKALWINREEPISELPHCDKLHMNRREEFVCGRPIHSIEDHPDQHDEHWNNNGEYGMCYLQGYSSPEDCPIAEFYRNYPVETIRAEPTPGARGLDWVPFFVVRTKAEREGEDVEHQRPNYRMINQKTGSDRVALTNIDDDLENCKGSYYFIPRDASITVEKEATSAAIKKEDER